MTTDSRTEEMRVLRSQGLTMQEIGEQFGVSREWVRRLIGNTGYVSTRNRLARERRATERFRKNFKRAAFQWLADLGYYRCRMCGIWKDFNPSAQRCRECNRKHVKAYYQAHPDKVREWQCKHPERMAAACKRWYDKHVKGRSTA